MSQINRELTFKLPKVSIVVTNYNYACYIISCLQSIERQTYKQIECIIIDDCSTDNSVLLIEDFIQNTKNDEVNFILKKNENNIGQFGSFIKGIKHASGDFISFIDADDVLLSNFVSIHVGMHLKTCVALTVCKHIEIDKNNTIHTLNSMQPSALHELNKNFDMKNIENETYELKIENTNSTIVKCITINIQSHPFGGWYWAPTSCAMLRKASIDILRYAKNLDNWNICADQYLFNFAHLIGGSALFDIPLVAYRRHNNNNFSPATLTGNIKYLTDRSNDIIQANRQRVASDILFLFLENKQKFLDNFGYEGLKNLCFNITKNIKFNEINRYCFLIKKILEPMPKNYIKYRLIKTYLISKLKN